MKRLAAVLVMCSVLASVFAGGAGEQGTSGEQTGTESRETDGRFDRRETVFVTGGMWAVPTSFNPITWDVPAGLRGFVHESLFFYDPLENRMKPWVAKDYSWDGDTLELIIHENAAWADGESITPEDVVFTFEYPAWSNPFTGIIQTEIVDASTIRITFDNPNYHSLQQQLYVWPVIKKSFWEAVPPDDAVSVEVEPTSLIGSGPYTIEAVDQDRVVYLRNDEWWGIQELGITFPAKRVVYLKSMSNNVAMALLSQGRELDMANNFIPGTPMAKAANPDLHTWYADEPYMLPDNIVFLMPNNTMAPFNDREFRRAMAWAIDPEEIVDVAFEHMAQPVSTALGLVDIPAWEPYINTDIAASMGFSFDPQRAEQILDRAGYRDRNDDGWRDYPDGSPLEFSLAVPYGWTDWMGAARIIVEHLNAVGLNADVDFPDEGRWQTDMVKGEFELILQNWGSYLSHSPYTLYMYLFSTLTPVGEDEWTGNFGRYDNPELQALVEQFGQIPVSDVEAGNRIVRQIQEIHMEELPYIPLWVNGMWFSSNTTQWENWPGAQTSNKHYPSLFTDKLQMGGLLMLSEITPVR